MERYATLHYQPGPRVYLYTPDMFLDATAEAFWQNAHDLGADDEIVGIGQEGVGIETAWWDDSGKDWVYCPDPDKLQELAHKIRARLASENRTAERIAQHVEGKEMPGYLRKKGGPGSGNFGHEGRPGQVGGSTSGSGLYGGGQEVLGAQLQGIDRKYVKTDDQGREYVDTTQYMTDHPHDMMVFDKLQVHYERGKRVEREAYDLIHSNMDQYHKSAPWRITTIAKDGTPLTHQYQNLPDMTSSTRLEMTGSWKHLGAMFTDKDDIPERERAKFLGVISAENAKQFKELLKIGHKNARGVGQEQRDGQKSTKMLSVKKHSKDKGSNV